MIKRTAHIFLLLGYLTLAVLAAGCNGTMAASRGSSQYSFSSLEPEWIRNGEPIVFENEPWYPKDDVDILTDNEVYLLGEYNSVQFFVEKLDVRPYHRLYTKFSANKYRIYRKNRND